MPRIAADGWDSVTIQSVTKKWARTSCMTKRSGDVNFEGLNAYLAQPEGKANGGVLMLPTIFGINAYQRSLADRLAGLGLAALVWNSYSGKPAPSALPDALALSRQLQDAPCLQQMSRWVDYMQTELALKSIGSIGVCLGGRYGILLCARDKRLAALVSFYPTVENPRLPNQQDDAVALASDITCPVYLSVAGINRVTSRETSLALQTKLQERVQPTISELYPEGEHGFLERQEPPNKAASELSLRLSLPFLLHHLG